MNKSHSRKNKSTIVLNSMKIINLTWLGFFLTLSSLSIAPKTLAVSVHNSSDISENIESRLNRISEVLKVREKELSQGESALENLPENKILLGRFVNGGRGWLNTPNRTFLNRSGPGGFLNNNRGSGFLNNRGTGFLNQPRNFLNNRGWRDGGGFLNHRW